MRQRSYRLNVPDEIARLIGSLHPDLKKKVRSSLRIIVDKPESGKALKDELAGLRSFRVGKFRIIYRISSGRPIELLAIGPRVRIYEETYRILIKQLKEKAEKGGEPCRLPSSQGRSQKKNSDNCDSEE